MDKQYGYICFYNGKRVELYATSQYAAVLAARAHFKPPKSKQHLVTATLAEKDGKPVEHVAVD